MHVQKIVARFPPPNHPSRLDSMNLRIRPLAGALAALVLAFQQLFAGIVLVVTLGLYGFLAFGLSKEP